MKFVKDFRIIELPLSSGNGIHYLYIKEHTDRNLVSKGKKLFVGNFDLSIHSTNDEIENYLTALFSRFGAIESIYISSSNEEDKKLTRFSHIEFAKKSFLKLSLEASDELYFEAGKEINNDFFSENGATKLTKSFLKSRYGLVDEDPNQLQEDVDNYMENFEQNEILEKIKQDKKFNEVDDDGFKLVKHR
jgi:hypothetical protein